MTQQAKRKHMARKRKNMARKRKNMTGEPYTFLREGQLTLDDLLRRIPRIEPPDEDSLVTCRECDEELPDDKRCEASEDGEHTPDMELYDPPEDQPTREIRVEWVVRVPNDGYEYFPDVVGRLERMGALLLLDPYVTSVTTGGQGGSAWVEDVEPPSGPHPAALAPTTVNREPVTMIDVLGGQVRVWESDTLQNDLGRMYVMDALGVSVLVREREDGTYVHIEDEGVVRKPLLVEVDNGGEHSYGDDK